MFLIYKTIMAMILLLNQEVGCDWDIRNTKLAEARRQVPEDLNDGDPEIFEALNIMQGPSGIGGLKGGMAEAEKFTTPTTTTKRLQRTTPERASLKEECDYLAHYCLRAYRTGRLCGRTIFYKYQSFTNYCMLDYVNCREKYEVWQIVHMGECFEVQPLEEYTHYVYYDDFFLDQKYIQDDW